MFHDNIGADTIIQIILIAVIIIQTSYIGTTMRFNRRVNQYNLTQEWNQKLTKIYQSNATIPHLTDPPIHDNEFLNLIDVFTDMHSMFKDKLLNPSDFMVIFMRLYSLTNIESEKKSKTFRLYHMQLQLIYDDFNNPDVMIKIFNYVDTDMIETISKSSGSKLLTSFGISELQKNYAKYAWVIKFVLVFQMKIKKIKYFELPKIK